ncbi:hypothetical protein NCAS_0B07220 [Naumovozyma castellii]|uniref:Aminotransferase class I/classII large domain-containing protein n=1 Tax=Naumovozyma castellii TaxID=27288 RepID=G0VA76_NAUCA|nr:hypothetical protein NCAS_0B07220 [Naumovozyma castellii CBS 4309]CCC68806.1 hypothetical protein NCAS_0B07220 [Naumovozyma castellii CBS 4309]
MTAIKDNVAIANSEHSSMTLESLRERYSKFLSRREANRKVITFWAEDEFDPNSIQMSGGMPNEGFFPIESINLKISNTPHFEKSERKTVTTNISKETPVELPLSKSMQYSETRGLNPLLDFIRYFIKWIGNSPPYEDSLWEVMLANGSSDSMFKVFETLCDESDTVLMEEFTFVPVISNVMATGAKCIPIKVNLNYEDQGIDIDYLSNLLNNWKEGPYKHLSKPKILYTISTGQNPMGMTLSMEKREKIYQIAQQHDLIILEDDPYTYLTFPKFDPQDKFNNPYENPNFTIKEYLQNHFTKSFITLDNDGRVIRLETFSKLFAPGLRLSFIIANKFLLEKFVDFSELSSRAPSGTSQAIVYSTVKALTTTRANNEKPDLEQMSKAWLSWIIQIAKHYTNRRNITLSTLYESNAYKKKLFSVIEPSAGMFINLKINNISINILEEMNKLDKLLSKNGVKVILGYKMAVSKEFSMSDCNFIRITISFAKNEEELKNASNKITKSIEEYFQKS